MNQQHKTQTTENLSAEEAEEMFRQTQTVAGAEAAYEMARAAKTLRTAVIITSVALALVSVLAAIGFFRHPKVMVAVTTPDGRRIAMIDDVNYGATEPVQMGEDNLNNQDKEYLVNQFLKTYYGIDLASRSKDIQSALQMMIPQQAKSLYKSLNENGTFQRERDEAQSAVWTKDSLEFDRNEKNIVQVIGTQKLRRNVGGKMTEEKIQYKIIVEVYTEGKREGTPLRTGYWITNVKAEEISRTPVS